MSLSNHSAADIGTPLSAVFWNRVHRYRSLLRRRWWVLALTISLALCLQAWRVVNQPPMYRSFGRVIMSGSMQSADRSIRRTEILSNDFSKTITGLITGSRVRTIALQNLEAREGALPPALVEGMLPLEVTSEGTIFTVIATGLDPTFTRKYLEASMDALLTVRRDLALGQMSRTSEGLRTQLTHLEMELKADDEAILSFQRENKIVLTKNDDESTRELSSLKNKLLLLKSQADALDLQDPTKPAPPLPAGLLDTPLAGGSPSGGASDRGPAGPVEDNAAGDVRLAEQAVVKLQAEYDDYARDLKPRHPKMLRLRSELEYNQKLLDNLRKQNRETNGQRLALVRSLIKRTEEEITKAKEYSLDIQLKKAELDKLRGKQDRDQQNYNALTRSVADLKTDSNVHQDPIDVLDRASEPFPTKPGWVKALLFGLVIGLGSGVGILFLLDRLDDRMGSFSDFQSFFSEPVIGQIPRDAEGGGDDLLQRDDPRHQLVESYRNIRSSLLYMPLEGERPRTLLITSAIPNEGKSTIAQNLALVMAFAGMKTLLIDCDLRRGQIHDSFGLTREPGFTGVLAGEVPWREAVKTTAVENLYLLPRGRNVPQPSELLINPATDELLKEIYPEFDYIIIDSSPLLAADDTASLAPKIDAVLFVVRLAFTPAKMTRKALEILEKRQANIPGLILNFVDTKSPEFVYYQYPEYYHSPVPEERTPAKVG
jgi:capsular exopolysaccharide synthesis family protein